MNPDENYVWVPVPEYTKLQARLAEQTETLSRLLTEGIMNAPCPTPAQWRQVQDFCMGYLAALRREDE